MTHTLLNRRYVPQFRFSGGSFSKLIALLGLWYDRHCERQQLSQLSPHMLRDIGISQARARREASKFFWKA